MWFYFYELVYKFNNNSINFNTRNDKVVTKIWFINVIYYQLDHIGGSVFYINLHQSDLYNWCFLNITKTPKLKFYVFFCIVYQINRDSKWGNYS